MLAVATVVASSVTASAQFPVRQEGDALDANPRLGSGGRNDPVGNGQYGGYGTYNNNVVTGNVTGGRQFRDSVGYTDPRAFRDGTGGAEFDAFNRSASGVTTGGRLINYADAGSSQSYFGDNTVANPPDGFVRTPGTGGYTPARNTGFTADLNTAADFRATADFNSSRGAIAGEQRDDSPLSRLFNGGALDASARVGGDNDVQTGSEQQVAANRQRLLDSPEALFLGNRLTAGTADRSLADASGRSLSPYTRLGRDERLSLLTGDRLRALGGELLRDGEGQPVESGDFDSLINPANQQASDASADSNVGGAGLEQIERGLRPQDRVLRLADPSEQSAQYAQLQRRLDRFKSDPLGENMRRTNVGNVGQDNASGTQLPGLDFGLDEAVPADNSGAPVGGGAAPQGGGAAPMTPQPQGDGETTTPEAAGIRPADPPVLVGSFAAGVTSPTLKDVLNDAEQMLTEGQYVGAVARYEAASRLVPNQPLVILGRGTAELAAGYYRRATNTLREALSDHPELAMARVGVADLIGERRVGELSEDLRQLAEANPDSDVPVFLLAYLSYGSEDYARAGRLLEEAGRRSGDPFYANVRQLWLPDAAPPAQPQVEQPEQPAAAATPTTRPDEVEPLTPSDDSPLPDLLPGDLSK